MVRKRTRRLLGAIFVLVGGLLLVAALFTPWYADDGKFNYGTSEQHLDTMYYLGLPWMNGTVQSSCNYSPCPGETSYSSFSTNGPGVVAVITLVLVTASIVLAIIAGASGMDHRRNANKTSFVVALAVAALSLGVAATAFYAAAFQVGYGGPWSSFWGSSLTPLPTTGPAITYTWGPSVGWYLSTAAAAALLVGTVILIRSRHDPGRPAPSSMPPEPTPAPDAPKSTT